MRERLVSVHARLSPARLSGEGYLVEPATIDSILGSEIDIAAFGPSLDTLGAHITPLAACLALGDPT